MADTNQNCNWGKTPTKSKSLIAINNGFSALHDDVDDKRDNSSLKNDNGSFSIQVENIKLKQKAQYLESKVDQRKVNRPNSSEIMKRDSGESRYSSHGNIQNEDRQTHMKEISEDHQVRNEVVITLYNVCSVHRGMFSTSKGVQYIGGIP